ncbi:MAG: methyltransferase domain-containing protein [Ferruginibacter sp.]
MPADNVAFSGSVPEKYDRFLGPLLFDPYALDMAERVKVLSPVTILEIACGTGRVTDHLAVNLPQCTITASDLNEDMIRFATQRMRHENIQWLTADAQELPFADESFDLIVCQFGFMFMPDKAKAFSEAWRVLKKNGSLLFNTWDRIEHNLPAYLSRQVVNAFFEGNPPVFYNTPFSMYNTEEIEGLLQNAGFKNITVEQVMKPGESPTARATAMGFIEGNPIYMEIIKKDPGSIPEIIQALTEKLAEKLGDDPLRCELSAFVSSAVK